MKKNEIFTFTTPNGVEVTAVAIYAITLFTDDKFIGNKWICYAQNRLFTMTDYKEGIKKYQEPEYGEVIADYAILPEYDTMLEDYYHQHEESVKIVQGFGYTKVEASNILEGKNPDGTKPERLPF